ncbi:MAG: acyl-CoA/acyl-ACP dehydrogenase [Deltaproteobacteria bacterium]|nr:acyl-CoA/acyl-ACP dehydrogenase [Deltaproteobacteria bacterium]
MDFAIPTALAEDIVGFKDFVKTYIKPNLPSWNQNRELPPAFFHRIGEGGWFGLKLKDGRLTRESVLMEALVAEELAIASPGVAVAALAHVDLGLMGLFLYGTPDHHQAYGASAVRGRTLMCLGNTENIAGSDVAGIAMTAEKVDGGWVLNGTKAYVTNGYIADLAVITAVSDPQTTRNRRLSMYLVNLKADGVHRTKLNKQVWIPSDLTRLKFDNVFVPEDHLLGNRGRGLQQVLDIFTNSRVPIAALTLGGAVGAFNLAVDHMQKRKIFGRKLVGFQAKAFELSDFYAKIESARLMLWKACWKVDQGADFRQAASLAKYLTVKVAREVTLWAADIFGAASVVQEHPIHKYPMDTWGSSLGEGTQDVQKLVIFREFMKRFGAGQ